MQELIKRQIFTLALKPCCVFCRSQSDYGVYYCHAENAYGLQETPCVIQLGLPGKMSYTMYAYIVRTRKYTSIHRLKLT